MSVQATYSELGRVVEQLADIRNEHGAVPVDIMNDAAERVGKSPATMRRLVRNLVNDGSLPAPPPSRKITLTDEQKALARTEWFRWAGNMKATHDALSENPDFPPMTYKTFTRIVKSWPDYLRAAAMGGFGEMMKKQGVFTENIPHRTHTYGIDHTKLPIRVRKSRTSDEWETPWLTIVLDLHARTIMAWHLSLETPTTHSVMEVLSESFVITETEDGLFGGMPQHIRSDNGSDFQSTSLRHALLDLGIHHDFTVPYTARQNGRVERSWRTIKGRFAPTQPGYSRGADAPNELRVRQTPVDPKALLTLEEVEENFTNWVNDWFHSTPHPQHKSLTRLQVWHDSPQPLNAPDDVLLLWAAMLHRENRVLQHYGIEYNSTIYQHQGLLELFSRSASKPIVDVRSSRRFPDRIYVFHDGDYVCTASRGDRMSDADRGAFAATRTAQDEKADRLMIAANHKRGLDAEEQIRRRDAEPPKAPSGLEFLSEGNEDFEFTDLKSRKEAS